MPPYLKQAYISFKHSERIVQVYKIVFLSILPHSIEIYLLAKSAHTSTLDVAERRVDNWLSESLALIINSENYFKNIYLQVLAELYL